MTSLTFSIHAPRQSWGVNRTLSDPSTAPVPTFSGVVGMIANALGRSREDDISDLSALGFAVRVDEAGEIRTEYQTQRDERIDEYAPYKARLAKNVLYLSDAAFSISVSSGDGALIESIREALESPERSLYLGRSSMPVGFVESVVSDSDVIEALSDGLKKPLHVTAKYGEMSSYRVRDIPVSFGQGKRHYMNRDVRVLSS